MNGIRHEARRLTSAAGQLILPSPPRSWIDRMSVLRHRWPNPMFIMLEKMPYKTDDVTMSLADSCNVWVSFIRLSCFNTCVGWCHCHRTIKSRTYWGDVIPALPTPKSQPHHSWVSSTDENYRASEVGKCSMAAGSTRVRFHATPPLLELRLVAVATLKAACFQRKHCRQVGRQLQLLLLTKRTLQFIYSYPKRISLKLHLYYTGENLR